MKAHNFSAGPCVLPDQVYQQAAQSVLEYNNSGLSILEISHRSKEFLAILNEARSLALELLDLNAAKYRALYLQGSASMEFLRVPYNLLRTEAAYIDTGVWASKAIDEAKAFGSVQVIKANCGSDYQEIPKSFTVSETADYVHYTSNNTIYGSQFKQIPQANGRAVVCDMSSDIFSRVGPWNELDLIYAGVQKNIGPAGLSLVLVNTEILGKTGRSIPRMLDYNQHIQADNLLHTANVFGVYTSLLNLQWLRDQGGVAAIEQKNSVKAERLYTALDQLEFIRSGVNKEDRSQMNVTFDFVDPAIATVFDEYCQQAGIVNIKGHRSLGGYRASLYNALPIESVEVLISVLHQIKHKI